MTEKLYYKDAYIKEFEAIVLSCEKIGEDFDIVLDKSAFFPEEGGQTSDKGYIDGIGIFDVKEISGIIHHYAKCAVNVNKNVHCTIDFDERFEKMQCHTAEHIVSGIFHKLYGMENTGFHLGEFFVTFDTSAEVDSKMLSRVEALANEAVYKNAQITVKYPSPEELPSLEYRSKLDITENVRIVDIEGYDSCACCAPHVNFTGEVGYIKFTYCMKHRSGSRITMLAGKRAYEYMKKIFEEACGVSALLSAPVTDIKSECEKLLSARADVDYKLAGILRNCAFMFADELLLSEKNVVVYYPMLDMDSLKLFANKAKDKVKGTLVSLIGEEGNYKYILMNDTDNFKTIVQDANAALSGKGGGRIPMAQGTYNASLSDIKKHFAAE